jgi:hypothetical protein
MVGHTACVLENPFRAFRIDSSDPRDSVGPNGADQRGRAVNCNAFPFIACARGSDRLSRRTGLAGYATKRTEHTFERAKDVADKERSNAVIVRSAV